MSASIYLLNAGHDHVITLSDNNATQSNNVFRYIEHSQIGIDNRLVEINTIHFGADHVDILWTRFTKMLLIYIVYYITLLISL